MAKKWCLNLVTESKKTPPKLQKSQKSVNLKWNNSTRIDLWKESLCLWTKYTNWSRNKINRTTGYCRWLFCFFFGRVRSLPKKKRVFVDISKKRQIAFYRCTYETTTACCAPWINEHVVLFVSRNIELEIVCIVIEVERAIFTWSRYVLKCSWPK